MTPVAVTGLTNATQLSAGSSTVCALRSDQTIACWGSNNSGQLGNGIIGGYSNVISPVQGLVGTPTAVAQESDRTCALMSDQTVQCWGNDQQGQLGIGAGILQPTPVAPALSCP
jgi:alpha-tubulin suppressor-like RCC1 family protein